MAPHHRSFWVRLGLSPSWFIARTSEPLTGGSSWGDSGPGVWKLGLHRQECARVYMQDCMVRTGASPNHSERQFRPRGAGPPQSHTTQESQVGHRDPSADGIWPSLLPVLFTFSFNSFIFNCTMLMHFQCKKKNLPTIDMWREQKSPPRPLSQPLPSVDVFTHLTYGQKTHCLVPFGLCVVSG